MSIALRLAPPLQEIAVEPLRVTRLAPLLGERELLGLHATLGDATATLAGRQAWCVSSTARGGGVAQMLHASLGYATGEEVPVRWAVLAADQAFFRITKRLHNLLHGFPGDGAGLTAADRERYEAVTGAAAASLCEAVAPGDVVVLHDPQTLGMAPALDALGALVVWRCHVGADRPGEHTSQAWSFLAPYLAACRRVVFSAERFVPPALDPARVCVIAPAIDPMAAKNRPLSAGHRDAVLAAAGVVADGPPVPSVARAVQLTQKAPVPAGAPYVLHLSRWDRLKDPVGVMEAFARHVVPRVPAHLVLAGPSPSVVDDDPEGAQVLEEVLAAWADLPGDRRAAVHVAVLPLEAAANDLVVNALQRGAAVVVKKSIGEGFGLGLTEALWKARPVVASAVGGVREQVVDEVTGLLVDDPGDLRAAGAAIVRLVEHPGVAAALGRAGHRHVRRRFLEPRHLVRWTGLLQEVVSPRAGP